MVPKPASGVTSKWIVPSHRPIWTAWSNREAAETPEALLLWTLTDGHEYTRAEARYRFEHRQPHNIKIVNW